MAMYIIHFLKKYQLHHLDIIGQKMDINIIDQISQSIYLLKMDMIKIKLKKKLCMNWHTIKYMIPAI